jgi:hypothetical protein
VVVVKRRTQRGAHVAEPRLYHGYHVHVALYQYYLARFGKPREVYAVQVAAFVEDGRVGRVEVLRLPVTDYPPAKTHYVAARVEYGEHQPRAEPVAYPFVGLNRQTRQYNFVLYAAVRK